MNKIEAFDFASEKWELQNPEKAAPELRKLEISLKERDVLRQAKNLIDDLKNKNIALEKLQARLSVINQVLTSNTTTTTPVPGAAPQMTTQAGQSANPEYGRIAAAVEKAEIAINEQIQKVRELNIDGYKVNLANLKLGSSSAEIEVIVGEIEKKIAIKDKAIKTRVATITADHPKSIVPDAEAIKLDSSEVAMKRILGTIGKIKPKA